MADYFDFLCHQVLTLLLNQVIEYDISWFEKIKKLEKLSGLNAPM